jgi:hypothetical protein
VSDSVATVERIEEQHLRNIIAIGVKQDSSRDEVDLRYFLATIVLRHYLGTAWCDECVKPDQSAVSRGSRAGRLFLRTGFDTYEDRYRHGNRVERLAQLLYKLQDVPGIADRRASIQEGKVESTYAELEFAWHFVLRDIPIGFRDRSGVKGNDYDFDAGDGASAVCCEVKCKLESTDLGENTIINALKTARQQVPADRPAIIGVKIPESWISDSSLRGAFESAVKAFFRNSERTVAVAVRWEEVLLPPTGGGLTLNKVHVFPNQDSPHFNDALDQLVQRLTQLVGAEIAFREWWCGLASGCAK